MPSSELTSWWSVICIDHMRVQHHVINIRTEEGIKKKWVMVKSRGLKGRKERVGMKESESWVWWKQSWFAG